MAERAAPDRPSEAELALGAADELIRCNQCGLCLSTCPTYRVTLCERFVARGRNFLAQLALGGNADDERELAEPLFQCLLCGACTVACHSEVHTDEIMVAMRERFWRLYGRHPALRLFFDTLLPNPRLLTRLVRAIALAKRTGLSALARRLGLLRWINARLEGAEGLVQSMPRSFLRDRLASLGFRSAELSGQRAWIKPPAGSPAARMIYFVGCGTNFQLPHTAEAAMRVLSAAGAELVVLENFCCGLPPFSYGDLGAAELLARRNLEVIGALSADAIVTECGSCSRMLKEYARLFGPEFEAISARVLDFTEAVDRLGVPCTANLGRVTYHDPCHMVRGQGLADLPRRLIRQAGAELVELPEADWCCGGAGTYNIMHPDLSLKVLERKMRNIAATGVDTVVTACPSCIIQLQYGARKFGPQVDVIHISELLARACQVARP